MYTTKAYITPKGYAYNIFKRVGLIRSTEDEDKFLAFWSEFTSYFSNNQMESYFSNMCEKGNINKIPVEKCTRDVLLELGGRQSFIGFKFAVESVLLCLENEKYLENITYQLYPTVARKFSSTASRVERGIRYLCEDIFNRPDNQVPYSYFKGAVRMNNGKPANKEFIARVVDLVNERIG